MQNHYTIQRCHLKLKRKSRKSRLGRKTGSTNEYRDSWLIVSTPSITISSWAGHDDNTGMDSKARIRSANYLANLINQAYQAKPDILALMRNSNYHLM